MMTTASRPRLAAKTRLRLDGTARRYLLLAPERGLLLNETAREIVELCTGARPIASIVDLLVSRHPEAGRERVEKDVVGLISRLTRQGLLAEQVDEQAYVGRVPHAPWEHRQEMPRPTDDPRHPAAPYTVIAELTYRCPLRCLYCSNPTDASGANPALDTSDWCSVFRQAAALGAVQLNLTGGEPLLREDLQALIAEARSLDLYTNLITSGVPLERRRLVCLHDAGLDSVQLSFQAIDQAEAERVAGADVFAHKLAVAGWVKELGLPLTINVVLHRGNIDSVAQVIEWAEALGADRLELANTQYLGWALVNRSVLLPTREQIGRARVIALAARDRLVGRMEVLFVTPDYYADRPKACMDGWGRRYLVITPDGLALPCHAAHTLPGLAFERVATRPLHEIWQHSEGFTRFRGDGWMPEPCRSCEQRTIDFGGCRCQAFHLTGNAAATDPACRLSPHHDLIVEARSQAGERDPGAAILRIRSVS